MKENEFRAVKYSFRRGYLQALISVFDILSRMHADYHKWDRSQVDHVWAKVKELENNVREAEFKERS